MKKQRRSRLLIGILVLAVLLWGCAGESDLPERGMAGATQTTTLPTTVSETEPTTLPTTPPITEPTTEPTTEPIAEPTTEPTTQPTTEPTTESTKQPTGESSAIPERGPATEENCDYILNTNTHKFHYPNCGSAAKIKDKNKEYFCGTRDELIARGFDPCGNCDP